MKSFGFAGVYLSSEGEVYAWFNTKLCTSILVTPLSLEKEVPEVRIAFFPNMKLKNALSTLGSLTPCRGLVRPGVLYEQVALLIERLANYPEEQNQQGEE